ncbi:phosphoribosylamine--glycine ligase [Spirochaeta dissipatitropha]
MNILVIGNGGREHAILWKLSQSESVRKLYAYPGNAGTEDIARNIPAPSVDPEWKSLIATCRELSVDWVFIGPEQALTEGVVDALAAAGIPAFGPHASAARLEGSKSFSKDFMLRNNIPTARSVTVHTEAELEKEIAGRKGMIVLKKSGLAAGKGVFESDNSTDLLEFGRKIIDSDSIVIEEYLKGYEVSVFTLSNGRDFFVLPVCADYKKAGDNNTGPNTGGMGAICPVPWFSDEELQKAVNSIIVPTHKALEKEGLNYTGVLYFGLMIDEYGAKLLEYNVRFGDPEAQILMPLIQGDFAQICQDLILQRETEICSSTGTAVTVVAAAPGYPGDYPRDLQVRINETSAENNSIFHASTYRADDSTIRTSGGRCFTATGWGADAEEARKAAYECITHIDFKGMWYRSDIGKRIITSPAVS